MSRRGYIALSIAVVGCLVALIFFSQINSEAVQVVQQPQVVRDEKVKQNQECPHLFISWNLANFGKSKKEESLQMMARVLKDADIVAVQEVNAGKDFGGQALATLASRLSDTSRSSFDYVVSDPTLPRNTETERYGYLTRKDKVSFSRKDAFLVSELEELISREPFSLIASFKQEEKIQFFTIHTVPTKKRPELEVEAFPKSSSVTQATRAIFAGDFNLPGRVTDKTFIPLGYTGHISEKTSLKNKLDVNGGYRFHQYDNIYTKGITVCESGVIDFVKEYFSPVTNESLKKAKEVSDHLPVYIRFK